MELRSVVSVVVIFIVFTAVFCINLVILEQIAKDTPMETDRSSNYNFSMLNLYGGLGSIAWIIVVSVLVRFLYKASEDDKRLVWIGVHSYYCLILFIFLIVCPNVEPFTEFREYKKGKDGIGAPQIRISCSANTIPVENTYVTLVENEWQPSLNTSIIETRSEDGWDYVLSPILHNGPLKNCVIKPQIYAACIAKNTSGNEVSVCGWGRTGLVTIRKLDASPNLEGCMKSRLPCASFPDLGSKYGWWNKNVIFEWNTKTRRQMTESIKDFNKMQDQSIKRIIIAWFLSSGVIGLLWIISPECMAQATRIIIEGLEFCAEALHCCLECCGLLLALGS
eukprot:TRINITY_DN874_c0_g1_i8.p1 TRINITY_DN874_c0_g1~~TRINITY_DN874_c0_g1_i8.p1  ORF type:complete len:348 (+),score=30.22 TRINITY_DN874_c0_g1_i8:39-1046(+)